MKICKHQQMIDRWLDGDTDNAQLAEEHLAVCPACIAYVSTMRRTREAIRESDVPMHISDAQLGTFLEGIREQTEAPAPFRRGRWALASLAAAALVMAVSLSSLFSQGPETIEARTTIEEVTSEIEGATTTSYYSDDGTPTVWINLPEGDMW